MLSIEFPFSLHISPYPRDRLQPIYLRKNAALLAGLLQLMIYLRLLQNINLLPLRSLADGTDFHFRRLGTRQSDILVSLLVI